MADLTPIQVSALLAVLRDFPPSTRLYRDAKRRLLSSGVFLNVRY